MSLPAAVLFDMDGLLVDTERLWHRAESDIVTSLGGEWTLDRADELVGGPIERAIELFLEWSGADVDPLSLQRRLSDRMDELLRTEPLVWRPGARLLLTSLRDAGVPRALVSASWRANVDAVLVGVTHDVGDDAFVTSVAGDDLPRTKPYPDPYLEAARRLGVDIVSCVVLEDSTTGTAAGVAAGALVVAVPSAHPIGPAPGLRVVASLLDVTPALLGDWSEEWVTR